MTVTGAMSASADDGRTNVAITIYADGESTAVTTDAETVGEVLDRAEVMLEDNDRVEPSAESEISSDTFTINVYRSRPVVVVDEDGEREKVETAHRSKRRIAEETESFDIYEEDEFSSELITDFLDAQYVGYRVHIDRATPVNLTTSGELSEVRTQAQTVAELFDEKDMEVGEDDVVEPSLDSSIEPGMDISLVRIGYETVTEEVELEPETQEVRDNDMPVGQREVENEGSSGLASITYDIKYEDGEEVRREEISRDVIEEPVTRVVVVGNKTNYDGGPLNEEQMNALGFCESGMDPEAVSPDFGTHRYYGAFQFRVDTWQTVNNEYSLPTDASLAVQKEAVQTLLSRSSIYTQFPACAQQMRRDGIL